jgi:hypothetical protein
MLAPKNQCSHVRASAHEAPSSQGYAEPPADAIGQPRRRHLYVECWKSLFCRAWHLLPAFWKKLTENLRTYLLHVICNP